MGAGILPISLYRNGIVFLFGKETSNGLWSDFGGSRESKENYFQTAIREGGEELNGFLGSNLVLAKRVKDGFVNNLYYDKYTIYIFKISFNKELPNYFNNNYEFSKEHLPQQVNKSNGLFEKSEIKWFTYDDLRKDRDKFRPFYRPIIDLLIKDYNNLVQTAKNSSKLNQN